MKNSDKNLCGIESCYQQIKQQKQKKSNQFTEEYEQALKEIRNYCGCKEVGEYTLQDATLFLVQKYNAKEITKDECKDYVVIDFKYEESKFVYMLTEGYISDISCKIFLLPPKYQGKIIGNVKKNGAVLFLNYEGDKVDYWYFEGHSAGYREVWAELDIFKGKSSRR